MWIRCKEDEEVCVCYSLLSLGVRAYALVCVNLSLCHVCACVCQHLFTYSVCVEFCIAAD